MKILASEIVKKYGTNDPYTIAKAKSILIVKEPLGNIYGYYNMVSDQKFIHLNDGLPAYFHQYVVAHLLYRAYIDQDKMLFLKRKCATRFTDAEKEANCFAMNLLVSDEEIKLPMGEIFQRHGMTDNDIEDYKERLNRVWGDGKTPFDELFWKVIKQMRDGEHT